MEKKIAVLKLAQAHQIEILKNEGIISELNYHEHGDSWEYEVAYLDVHLDGDTQCCFDEDSL